MLTAHLRQATTMKMRVREAQYIWSELENLQTRLGLPKRTISGALYEATHGYRLRNATYKAALAADDEAVSDQTATRDLQKLVEAGLLEPKGKARGRYYIATETLRAIRQQAFAARKQDEMRDPFQT